MWVVDRLVPSGTRIRWCSDSPHALPGSRAPEPSGLAVEVSGCVGLIHPESHFTDEKAGPLRSATYRRLRRHWQFVNELSLFEVHHLVTYGVHTYGPERPVSFLQASSLYHPATVEASFKHLGSGAEPGLKDPDGNWDLRPHAHRIQHIDHNTLATWHGLLENDDVPIGQTRMVYTVNRAAADVINKLAAAPRLGSLGLKFSRGWDESIDRKKGRFQTLWGIPESWDSVILQGPHLHVANPFYKSPNATMLHNQDWTPVDLETLPPDAIPVTSYKPAGDPYEYDVAYTDWGTETDPDPARDQYRIAWRKMAANTGERTLISTVIPPGSAHIDGIYSLARAEGGAALALVEGWMSSLLLDFATRAAPKANIRAINVERLPFKEGTPYDAQIGLRVLRLTCLTQAHVDLWRAAYLEFESLHTEGQQPVDGLAWTGGVDYPGRPALADIGPEWTPDTPLRRASDRRQALLEIDALVALSLNITLEELVTIYRTQFPVLYGYDHHSYVYDANGRLVPTSVLQAWRSKGEQITPDERRVRPPGRAEREFALPFNTLDREADWAAAFAALQRQP